IGRPLDDVDLLAAQLPADYLDAGAAQPDTRADRVHVSLGRGDGNLRPLSRLPGRLLHLDDALGDFRDLRLEQPDEQSGVRPRQHDLRALDALLHLEHVGADAIARAIPLAGDLLALHQHGLGLADLDDHVALLDAVDDAARDLAFLVDELRVDRV